MKILVISDSHGNLERLRHVVGFAKKKGLKAIIHAGDWNTPQCVSTVTESGLPLYTVLGNADIDPTVASNLKGSNIYFNDDFLEFELGGRKIGVCHFPGKLKDAFKSGKYDVLFHGHRHRKKDELCGRTRLVNPGALQTAKPSFAVYDTEKNSVEFINLAV